MADLKVYPDYRQLPGAQPGRAVTIGSFDGLHLGHRHLLDRARGVARRAGLEMAVMTFEPHPARALAPELSPPLLMSAERKIRGFGAVGATLVLAQRFDREFASLSPEGFAAEVLVGALSARVVVVGEDFTFGRAREGSAETLRSLGRAHGFEVEVCRKLSVQGVVASSSRIRAFLLQGQVGAAAMLLGRPFVVEGEVVAGEGRGRQLGFPTANLRSGAELLPARGVYAGWAWIAGARRGQPAVTNIGVNPTFGPGPRTIEAHLLDFSGDLVRQHMVLAFAERLRDEVAFPSAADLAAQIGRDAARARVWAADRSAPELDPLDGIAL
ncbi:MAG: bifunctional riboflavin kinase/FAD synthetase [Deltaproteobacteria bacterium]|nr:bifunctional riboflavin kinase/FAD synthetase [Deltaproteobacteria bacterium]